MCVLWVSVCIPQSTAVRISPFLWRSLSLFALHLFPSPCWVVALAIVLPRVVIPFVFTAAFRFPPVLKSVSSFHPFCKPSFLFLPFTRYSDSLLPYRRRPCRLCLRWSRTLLPSSVAQQPPVKTGLCITPSNNFQALVWWNGWGGKTIFNHYWPAPIRRAPIRFACHAPCTSAFTSDNTDAKLCSLRPGIWRNRAFHSAENVARINQGEANVLRELNECVCVCGLFLF